MKWRPILFSAPMAVAIDDGSKMVTRRLIKHIPALSDTHRPDSWVDRVNDADFRRIVGDYTRFCPYGQPGDRLWVRETFVSLDANGRKCRPRDASFAVLRDGTQVYRDGSVLPGLPKYAPGAFDGIKWRPSIHMPRWASRITLEITAIRAERVQDITDDDALREGIPALAYDGDEPPRDGFRELWERIHGAGAWARNDGVWVVEFQRVDR